MNELLTVLGSGSVPSLYHAREHGREFRSHAGYLLDEHTLIEASAGVARRIEAAGVPLEDIRNVLISHIHTDHCQVDGLLQELWGIHHGFHLEKGHSAPPSVVVYGPPGLYELYAGLNNGEYMKYLYSPKVADNINIVWETYNDREPFKLDSGCTVTPYRVKHNGLPEAYALRFDDGNTVLTYSGDTGYCEGIIDAAQEADLFLCEAGQPIGSHEELTAPHLTPRLAGLIGREAVAKRMLYTHLPNTDSDHAVLVNASETFPGPKAVCHDGDVIPLVSLFR